MFSLLNSPLAPVIAFVLATMAAWKAAELLEADNFLAAVAVGAVFALVGPFLLGDFILAAIADATPAAVDDDEMTIAAPRIVMGISRVGFALMGVLAWCGTERAR